MPTRLLQTVTLMATALIVSLLPLNDLSGDEARSAKTTTTASAKTQKHVSEVLRAPTALHLRIAYKALLKKAQPRDLRKLKSGLYDGIALQLAWSDVTRSTFNEGRRLKQTNNGMQLDRRALSRFVGFLEGRLRVTIPVWWEKAVLGGRALNCDSLSFPVEENFTYQKTKYGPWAPVGTFMLKRGQDVLLQSGKESLTVPPAVIQGTPDLGPSVSALVGPFRSYVALHWSTSGKFFLFCIEPMESKVLWKTSVWADNTVLVQGGAFRAGTRPGVHAVTIKEQGDRVFVFGSDGLSIYVEGFKRKDGASLFRFCTSY